MGCSSLLGLDLGTGIDRISVFRECGVLAPGTMSLNMRMFASVYITERLS